MLNGNRGRRFSDMKALSLAAQSIQLIDDAFPGAGEPERERVSAGEQRVSLLPGL
jgi:hypothetical protein